MRCEQGIYDIKIKNKMRRILYYIIFVTIIVLSFSTACATRQTTTERVIIAEQAAIVDALKRGEFRFISHITPLHYVCVSPDIVQITSTNPYFGGSPFTLAFADFEYNVRPGRRAGTWLVQISSMNHLNFTLTTLNFRVREDGTATARSFVSSGTNPGPVFRESRGHIEIVENAVNDIVSIDD